MKRKTPLTQEDHRKLAFSLGLADVGLVIALEHLWKSLLIQSSEVKLAERIRLDVLKLRSKLEGIAADTACDYTVYRRQSD